MIEEISKIIDAEKEVLSTRPLKTPKNKKNYVKAVKELISKYSKEEDKVKEEITIRRNKILDVKKDPKIDDLNKRISSYFSLIKYLNNFKNSFELLGLDKMCYKLNNIRGKNLLEINQIISNTIDKYNEVGIKLTSAHFDYSHYTYEYALSFFKEYKNDLNSMILKDKFNDIFWKCPDIITHLSLNIKYIYLNNQDKIDDYFNVIKSNLLTKSNSEIKEDYKSLVFSRNETVFRDKYSIINKFLNGDLLLSDYSESNIEKKYEQIILNQTYFENNKEEVNHSIIELYYSILAYKWYIKYEYILDEIKDKYHKKNTYKGVLKDRIKLIKKLQTKLRKINLKAYKIKESNNNKTNDKVESLLLDANKIIVELIDIHNKLDFDIINDKVLLLNDTSTYEDLFKIAVSNYRYISNAIKEKYEEITEVDLEKTIKELYEFVDYPYNKIINNKSISENYIPNEVISDKYTLLNLKISPSDLTEENIDSLLQTVRILTNYIYIKESGINLEGINFLIESKQIHNTEENK